MKISILSVLLICAGMIVNAQNAYEKLLYGSKKANITFYKDEARTQPFEKLEPGQTEFYAVAPLRKKDFKFPLGKYAGWAEFNQVDVSAYVNKLKFGYSEKDIQIYFETIILPKTFAEIANQEEIMVKLKLDKDVNFISNVDEVLESGQSTFNLDITIGDDDEPFGYGVIEWDLSDGGQALKSADLASRANYTFGATDDVDDPDFKAVVKADIEKRLNVKIYQMAHGDRVPYTRGLNYYRRNQIGVTYKDLEDGNCYTGGISAFEDGAGPGGPYTYDREGSLSVGDQIPCDRVDK